MINVFVNNKKFLFDRNCTILSACEEIGYFIPRFCFDNNLKISGNCRMCLVEIDGFINPVASCTFKIFNNIKIFTDSALSKKSRENVLEFLLINHPLDCPICDQGGECDLQDLTLVYSADKTRFFEKKKTVEDLPENSIIKTIMTRCILCTKCVRFMHSINNKNNFGIIGRGKKMEIGFYTNSVIDFFSLYSANIIDLCPVGALTLHSSAFTTRDWLVKKYYNSFDILDNLCSDIVIHVYNNNIIKITPNLKLNTKYLSNSSRFFFDSIYYNRVKTLLKRDTISFKNIELNNVFQIFKNLLNKYDSSSFNFIVGDSVSFNNTLILYNFLNNLGANKIKLENLKIKINVDLNSNLLVEENILKSFDLCLLVGCNIEKENPSLAINLIQQKNCIYSIGLSTNLKFGFKDLGFSLKIFINILKGKHKFCKKLKLSKKPVIVFGEDFLNDKLNIIIINYIKKNFKFIKLINVFLNNSFINFMEIFGKKDEKEKKNKNNIYYLYNTKNFLNKNNKNNNFVIYYGHHFTNDAMMSDIIIPINSFFEERNIFININGKVKRNFSSMVNFLDNRSINLNNILNYLNIFFFNQKNLKNKKIFSYLSDLYIYICNDRFIYYNKETVIITRLNTNTTYKNKIYFNKTILENFSKPVY